ncbi:MAG: glycosyltransferase family 39 protein [Bacteroidales bacterium]|nr:glycosyltransferase family 39 protein [Bacteroidales bacterium]
MQNRTIILLILGVAALFFLPFLGGVHLFDWDEINFAEISREMIVLEDYLRLHINFQPFWEKPPLFFWLQVLAMKAFGIGEYAARLPNAIAGMVSLVVLFLIGNRLFNRRFGLLWALAYFGSVLPHLYFKSGIIDPWFNLFIFLGMYFFILFYWRRKEITQVKEHKGLLLFLSGVFIGLAILTKGPVGYLIPLLAWGVYWIMKKFRFYVSIPQFVILTLVAIGITLFWFGPETIKNGTWFVETFTTYQIRLFSTQDAGHGGFPGYHFVVLLLGCFPASVFAIRGFYKMKPDMAHQQNFRTWMIILFWVVLILFTIVQSKIVHYSSLAYFPLTFLAALTLDRLIDKKIAFGVGLKAGLFVIGSLYGLITLVLPFIGRNIEAIKPLFSNDPFAMANLEAHVNWTGWEALPGVLISGTLIWFGYFVKKDKIVRGITVLFVSTAIFVNLTLIFFIARIEMYSQHAAIEFCENLQGKDCYVITSGYKSYVQYFYPRIQPYENNKYTEKKWLLTGDIDKEVYILTKVHRAHELDKYKDIERIGSRNGFVFFRRNPPSR